MTYVVLTLCLAVVGFATARALGSGGAFILLIGVVVAGPYLMGVPPRTEREWLAVKICVIWLMLLFVAPGARLISR